MSNYQRINPGVSFSAVLTSGITTPDGSNLNSVSITLSDGTLLNLSGFGITIAGG